MDPRAAATAGVERHDRDIGVAVILGGLDVRQRRRESEREGHGRGPERDRQHHRDRTARTSKGPGDTQRDRPRQPEPGGKARRAPIWELVFPILAIVVVGYTSNVGPGYVWVYDPATDTVTQGGMAPVNIGYANNLVYYPPNQNFYLISNGTVPNGQAVFEVALNRGNLSLSTVTQVTGIGGAIPSIIETGFAYDSANQIIGGGVQNGLFYAYDPATKLWSSKVMQTSPAGGSVGTVAHHSLDYDPVNNVFIILTDYASGFRTWAYRYK